MPVREYYCENCATIVDGPGLKAPPGYYRCPVCRFTEPVHELPSRTMYRSMPYSKGVGVPETVGIPFGAVLMPIQVRVN